MQQAQKELPKRDYPFVTAAELEDVPPLFSQENEPDPMVWIKLFNPYGPGTWFVIEYDGNDLFDGAVNLGRGWELGSFSRSELEGMCHPAEPGVPHIERDRFFAPKPLSEAQAECEGGGEAVAGHE